jgi:hypothetical protein
MLSSITWRSIRPLSSSTDRIHTGKSHRHYNLDPHQIGTTYLSRLLTASKAESKTVSRISSFCIRNSPSVATQSFRIANRDQITSEAEPTTCIVVSDPQRKTLTMFSMRIMSAEQEQEVRRVSMDQSPTSSDSSSHLPDERSSSWSWRTASSPARAAPSASDTTCRSTWRTRDCHRCPG